MESIESIIRRLESATPQELEEIINYINHLLRNNTKLDVNAINWNGREIFFPKEVQAILNIGESSYRRWVDDGWLSETQMLGSNKRYIQKKDIVAFINNPKIRKEAWR